MKKSKQALTMIKINFYLPGRFLCIDYCAIISRHLTSIIFIGPPIPQRRPKSKITFYFHSQRISFATSRYLMNE
jgi:hypothetical protein